MSDFLVVVPDDPEHGVTTFATGLAGALAAGGAQVHRASPTSPDGGPAAVDAVLVQFTDRLWGPDVTSAARAFAAAVARLARPVVVTLHDLPDPDDAPERFVRRRNAYRRVAASAAAVVVSSPGERHRAWACGIDAVVVPLPVPVSRPPRRRTRPASLPGGIRWVGVLGFLYPGKGHEQVLDALEGLAPDVGLAVVGRAAAGHESLARSLRDTATARRRQLVVTGFVPDDDLPEVLADIAVPVVGVERPSASASLLTWVGAGRRPLVRDNSYTAWVLGRDPRAAHAYRDTAGLQALLRVALERPSFTRRDDPHAWATWRETAAGYQGLLERVAVCDPAHRREPLTGPVRV